VVLNENDEGTVGMTELEAKELLSLLPERQARVLEARFWHKKDLKCVASMLGVSHQRASQILKRGLCGIRRLLQREPNIPNVTEIMQKHRKKAELQRLKDFTANLAAAMKAKYPHL
jgi:hypothetical protein